jgi:hypothetical protein
MNCAACPTCNNAIVNLSARMWRLPATIWQTLLQKLAELG